MKSFTISDSEVFSDDVQDYYTISNMCILAQKLSEDFLCLCACSNMCLCLKMKKETVTVYTNVNYCRIMKYLALYIHVACTKVIQFCAWFRIRLIWSCFAT